jgi:hypothetical protein
LVDSPAAPVVDKSTTTNVTDLDDYKAARELYPVFRDVVSWQEFLANLATDW